MERHVIRSERLGEEYYCYRHSSGLRILLYPTKGSSSAYALFGTNYGSIDTQFKTGKDADFLTVPEGIAHFLEHKLFESEDGDAFELFAKTGASANAFTSFEKTCYLFLATSRFEESLKALITFVQDPYFTEQTVEKEQGIIGQEIRMYEDDPNWRVFFNLLGALYHNNPVRIDIAGTAGSIAKIDKDLLYRCYHTFYNLNNMVVAITGNFDPETAARIVEENLKDSEPVEIERRVPDEPPTAAEDEHVQRLSVAIPLFQIGYKETPCQREDELATQVKFEMLLSCLAGKGSELYKQMLEEELINETFGREVFLGRGFLANIFSGESRNPREVRRRIQAAIASAQKNGIPEETFSRAQKALYGAAVESFSNVAQLAHELVSTYFSGNGAYDALEAISSATLEELNELLRASFAPERSAISIVEPSD